MLRAAAAVAQEALRPGQQQRHGQNQPELQAGVEARQEGMEAISETLPVVVAVFCRRHVVGTQLLTACTVAALLL